MLNYLLRRFVYALLVLLGVNLLTFALFFTLNTPDDMARLNLGGKRVTQESIEKWKAERGYDKPLYINHKAQGTAQITETIFWERSVSLFALEFGRAASESAGDIGHEVAQRMGVSLSLALPLFVLQVIASTAFAPLLVMFRHSRLDFWGVVSCVLLLSISSLFYIIVGQFLFSRVLKLAPISGYAPGLDAIKFLILPVLLSLLSRLGGEARLYRAMFLEELGKDYVRTARAKGLAESMVLGKHVLRNALIPIVTSAGSYLPYVFLGSLIFRELLRAAGARRLRHRGHQQTGPWSTPGSTRGCAFHEHLAEIRAAVDRRRHLAAGGSTCRLCRDGAAQAAVGSHLGPRVPRRAGAGFFRGAGAVPGRDAARQRALPRATAGSGGADGGGLRHAHEFAARHIAG